MYIKKNKMIEYSNESLMSLGMPEKEANIITDVLLTADLREIHSHGFLRLPIYINRIQKGHILNKSKIDIVNEKPSSCLIDANQSAGQVAAKFAMDKSIELADKSGVGLVSVRNSNHFGITAYYSLMAANKGKIGIVISNVAPLMPAIGGKEKVIGNNPISIAAPTQKNPVVLDMALSNTAFGKVLFHKENNKKIPSDWGVDSAGKPTTDPNDIINGGLLSAVGGPKGFGLAVMAEILTGVLSEGDVSKDIPSMYDMSKEQSISHLFITIDINSLTAIDNYNAKIEHLIDYIKTSEKSDGVDNIFLPGEIEFLKEKENEERGVPIEEKLFKQLNELAKDLGIDEIQ